VKADKQMDNQRNMTVTDHIQELRRRLLWIIIVFVISIVGGLILARPIIQFMRKLPPANGMNWHVFSPWDALKLYMNFGFMIALLFTLPVILYQLWAFVKPGLKETERKGSIGYVPAAFFLFVLGASFAYFVVFPFAFFFTSMISKSLQITELYGVTQYFSFMFNIVLPVSLLFELPVVVMFLTKIRILNPERLRKFRRYAYMLLVILSTVITPPDAISAILVALPLILLYEISLWLSARVHRKQLLQDEAREEAFYSSTLQK
jgi:sec-independent protein translocase protein TatC